MSQTIIGKQNSLTQSWAVTAGVATLIISGNFFFDMWEGSLLRVYDVTTSTDISKFPNLTFTNSFVAGLPVYQWVFSVPSGTVTGDTVLVYISLSDLELNNLLLQYQKA